MTYRSKQLLPQTKDEEAVTDRQQKLKGFSQQALTNAKVILIGAGGLGGEIGEALVRKGVGSLVILDYDLVTLTNLNRQLFYAEDLGKPKAHRLSRNLAKVGFCGTHLQGIALSFQDALLQGIDLTGTVIVCGVDNNPCRIAVSRYYRERSTPVVFTAVSQDASHGYSFVQEPDKACFVCQFPKALNDETYPCGTPAVKDILKVVAGIVSYTVDSLIMERLRCWNYKHVYLDGSVPDIAWSVPRRLDCPLCGVTRDDVPQTEGRA